jgi:hypothetical protein
VFGDSLSSMYIPFISRTYPLKKWAKCAGLSLWLAKRLRRGISKNVSCNAQTARPSPRSPPAERTWPPGAPYCKGGEAAKQKAADCLSQRRVSAVFADFASPATFFGVSFMKEFYLFTNLTPAIGPGPRPGQGKPCTILWGFVREGVLLVHKPNPGYWSRPSAWGGGQPVSPSGLTKS